MSDAELEKIRLGIQHKTVEYNEAMANAERIEEQIRVLKLRESNIAGTPIYDVYELDVSETVKTVELARYRDRGNW